MSPPRSASAVGKDFPYEQPTVCYIEVRDDGSVTQGIGNDTLRDVEKGVARLFAVWPGQWRSDLFIIDSLNEYKKAIGLIPDAQRTGLSDHEHEVRWRPSEHDINTGGAYITIDVILDCGCHILDIRAFAKQMQEQKGWNIATTSGWGGYGGRHYVRVRRKSLENPPI